MAAENGSKPQGWRFSDDNRVFRLYPERRQLLLGETKVTLGQRTFDMLILLVENAGKVVSREAIMSAVWRNIAISDAAVSTQASTIRKLIGNDESIVAVNNQGYVFTIEADPIEREYGPPPQLMRLVMQSGPGVGREAELKELAALCSQHRLVTLVGPGGVGKTWLAVKLGLQLTWDRLDGVYLIDLGAARDSLSVAGSVAQALGVTLRSRDNPIHILGSAIGNRRMLLILDSCEYVIEPVRDLVDGLLPVAPNLSILATSQEVLRVLNEATFRLEPLSPPQAIELFVARAQTADRHFLPNEKNAPAIAEICARLDGIPLALEMAAALVPKLGIEGVREGLDQQRFQMLDGSPRVGDARRATLTAITEWSYGLLEETDQQIFCRLSCFSGSFSREAIAAVAGADSAGRWDIAASLGRLLDKSLLVAERGDRPRYRLLETLRLAGAAKLEAGGASETIAERHARYYADLFEQADLIWETTPEPDWLALYGPEIDNLRAALDWTLRNPGRLPLALILAGAAGHLWDRLALAAEGRSYLDRLVERLDERTPPADAARILRRAAVLWRRTDRLRAVALLERSVALYRQTADERSLGSALGLLGGDYIYLGRRAEAGMALDEARNLLPEGSRTKSLYNVMNDLGNLAVQANESDKAREYYVIARDLARKLHDTLREYLSLSNLGEVEFQTGAVGRAIEYTRQAVDGLRSAGHLAYLGYALVNFASYLAVQGNHSEARDCALEALSLLRSEGGHWLRLCLQVLALLGARGGRYVEAAQLRGFVDAGYAQSGEVREPTEQRIDAELCRLLAANLPPDDIKAWAVEGARWSQDQAVDFVTLRLASA
jgi:predicted ATPase